MAKLTSTMKALAIALVFVAATVPTHVSGFVASTSVLHHGTLVKQQQVAAPVTTTILDPMKFSNELGSFIDELQEVNKSSSPSPPTQVLSTTTRRSKSPSVWRAFSRDLLKHAIISTIIVKYCLPRVPLLNPMVLTIVMTILKRRNMNYEFAVGSHEW